MLNCVYMHVYMFIYMFYVIRLFTHLIICVCIHLDMCLYTNLQAYFDAFIFCRLVHLVINYSG